MMIVKNISECVEFLAGDNSWIREVLHPKNDNIQQCFSLAYAIVKPKEKTLPHKLKASVEVYFILKGKGIMHINDESKEVSENDAVYIPPGSVQWIENTSDENLEFICVVSPPWNENDEEILKEK